ncbi:hypothetical protein GGI06_005767, partial [Coemansia sp. S85]
ERTSRTKKAIVTTKEEFEYPPEVDVDQDFGGMEVKYEQMRRANKLKGWRIRPSQEMAGIRRKLQEKHEKSK